MKAFDYFKILNTIPRGSYNEKQVASFLCDFAKEHNFKYEIDELYNVKIFKDNSSQKTIILQAHTDMVCEKLKDIDFDFKNQAIQTVINGDYIFAKGTTLGGDDGFGVSLILEMLENCGQGYPNIEAVFTSQEETGMGGAKVIDCSNLKGKYMLGLDGTNSSELIISCAGSSRLDFEKQFFGTSEKNEDEMYCYSLEISGLLGGHSGEDIDKNRANANIVSFNLLKSISSIARVRLIKIEGGGKDNAIPREFYAEFLCDVDLKIINNEIEKFLKKFDLNYPNEITRNIKVEIIECKDKTKILSSDETSNLITFVTGFKNGVLEKEQESVVCSINLANVSLVDNILLIRTMLRFNKAELQHIAFNEISLYAKKFAFKCVLRDSSPFFESSGKDELKSICEEAYYECGYNDLKILNIHAGLEGGIFKNKIKDLQVVVLGADLYEIHTPNEKLCISSLEKLSNWIIKILQNI